MDQENVSVTRTVAASLARVFAVLADPTTHAAIDGTGWVREAADREPLTAVGQVFRMNMFHSNAPDGHYRVANQVQVIDPPRTIGWRTGQEQDGGRLEFGGWFWRYDLAPAGGSGSGSGTGTGTGELTEVTEVTLTYDWSAVPAQIREYISFPPFEPTHLTDSLDHLAELAELAGPAELTEPTQLTGGPPSDR